jgi:hypothetical protein
VNVKIECECGQHYAFDVEPMNGSMDEAVTCPSCGADGTSAANAVIAGAQPQSFSPSALPVTGARLKVADPEREVPQVPAGVRVDARSLGLVDRAQAEAEARAKISWGDSQDDVVKYLMLQGFSVPEARDLVGELFKERLAALRVKGIRKIVVGSGLMCVPVIAFLIFAHIGYYPAKLLALAVMVGLYGAWQAFNGIFMLVAPKMEAGDLADD